MAEQGEHGCGSLDVQVEAVGRGVQTGQVGGTCGGDPLLGKARRFRAEESAGGEGPDEVGQGGHLGADGGEAGDELALAGGERGGQGEQEPRG